MIAPADRHHGPRVSRAEYLRLLGYPRGWTLRNRPLELAEWAEDWCVRHSRPWVRVREVSATASGDLAVRLDAETFTSPRLRAMFHEAGVHRAVIAAVSAGPELEVEAERRWKDEKPDEYFFLEVYGSAVVEHLVTMVGAELCASAERRGVAVLPHYSPGYPDWDIAEQARLLSVLAGPPNTAGLPIEVLESGMLRPKKSLLAVFGLTADVGRVRRLTSLVPCGGCPYDPCQFRRSPYRRDGGADPELPVGRVAADEAEPARDSAVRTAGPVPAASYSISVKALRRWADERLTLDRRPDGSIDALFRYEGTTCTNMGRPLQFHYRITLGSRAAGYPILEQHCRPAPGDTGHMQMCEYIANAQPLMTAIASEQPLGGRPLGDVLTWPRPAGSTGCYCDADSRQHKWGLVLETLHFALCQPPFSDRSGTDTP